MLPRMDDERLIDHRLPENDDPAGPYDEVTTGNPYHFSSGTRMLLRLVAVLLIVSMTALFLRGFIHT